jgi:hypothetical protein
MTLTRIAAPRIYRNMRRARLDVTKWQVRTMNSDLAHSSGKSGPATGPSPGGFSGSSLRAYVKGGRSMKTINHELAREPCTGGKVYPTTRIGETDNNNRACPCGGYSRSSPGPSAVCA